MDHRPRANVLVICTGNAARSVMAGFMFGHLSEVHGLDLAIRTAGTHTVEGQPMSVRTRAALATIPQMADAPVSHHRSHQLTEGDVRGADVVIAMEVDHVRYVRRRHVVGASRTGTIRRLSRDLSSSTAPLPDRIAELGLAELEVTLAEEVGDPAGRPDDAYVECARELWVLCQDLAPRLAW